MINPLHVIKGKASHIGDLQRCLFQKNGFIKITPWLDFVSFEKLYQESNMLLEHKIRREMQMSETSFTPRTMYNVKQPVIKEQGSYIPQLYHSDAIKNVIQQISGETVYDLPFEEEQYLVNCIANVGDTHGWHWDDYSYSIVFILKAPKLESGGLVQCVPHTTWMRDKHSVNKTLCEHAIDTYFFEDNEAYLLMSNTTMHRVTPLTQMDFRLSINMSWASNADLKRTIDHSTMDKLYE